MACQGKKTVKDGNNPNCNPAYRLDDLLV